MATILIVEDEPKMRRLLELNLSRRRLHDSDRPDAEAG